MLVWEDMVMEWLLIDRAAEGRRSIMDLGWDSALEEILAGKAC